MQFRFRWADIVLDDTDIPAPSLLTGIPRLGSEELASAEQQISRDWKQQRTDHVPARPRLLSLQRANVSGLAWQTSTWLAADSQARTISTNCG